MRSANGVLKLVHASLWFIVTVLCCRICASEKIRYASKDECDRYSLDAIYQEKYKPITNNIFADSKEFVGRVSDLVADSLTTVMSQLPDRDFSDNQEKKVHTQFRDAKSVFASKMKKMQRNITSSWEDLVATHFDLMFDNGKVSLKDYENKTIRMTDSYSGARQLLDTTLSAFVSFIKATVRDGLSGIQAAAEQAVKKEEEEREKNKTEAATEQNGQNVDKDEALRKKMLEISDMVVPGFLGKVTAEVIRKKLNLKKEITTKPEDRDTPLDDIQFDMMMAKNRIRAIVQSDVPKDKGAVDLARRSIYTYWMELADQMYQEKRQTTTRTSSESTGRLYYRNLWKDEEQIVETLLNLMEVYS